MIWMVEMGTPIEKETPYHRHGELFSLHIVVVSCQLWFELFICKLDYIPIDPWFTGIPSHVISYIPMVLSHYPIISHNYIPVVLSCILSYIPSDITIKQSYWCFLTWG